MVRVLGDKAVDVFNKLNQRYIGMFCPIDQKTQDGSVKLIGLIDENGRVLRDVRRKEQVVKCILRYPVQILLKGHDDDFVLPGFIQFHRKKPAQSGFLCRGERSFFCLSKLRSVFNYQVVLKYGFLLAVQYSEQVLEMNRDHVKALAVNARSRSSYDELSRYLMRMQQYKGGNEMVRSLCSEWMSKYPTRKVMVSELSRFT